MSLNEAFAKRVKEILEEKKIRFVSQHNELHFTCKNKGFQFQKYGFDNTRTGDIYD